jgi:hypothetical protein
MRRMRRIWQLVTAFIAIFAVVVVTAAPPPATPESRDRARLRGGELEGTLRNHNDAFVAALVDAEVYSGKVTPDEVKYIRYLTLQNIPSKRRPLYYNLVSVIINGFNKKRPTIVRPAWGGPDNILIRINLFDYHIDPAAWDKLGAKDPYFHKIIEIHEDIIKEAIVNETYKTGRFYSDGRPEMAVRAVKKTTVEKGKKIKKVAQAPTIDAGAAANLGLLLNTNFPVLRADWFIANVTVEPFYSDFLGIKTLDQLKDFGGFDKRGDVTEVKATVIKSGSDGLCARVAVNNRILERRSTLFGYWWETYDFKTSVGEQNVILNFLARKRDAAEYIVSGPNGLQWYLVTDGKDNPVPAGDINIVVDSMAIDSQVRNGRSCIWCHTQGINLFKSQFQNQVGWRPDQSDLGLYDKDPKKAAVIRQQVQDRFGIPDFDTIIKADQVRYETAIQACAGITAGEFASTFKQVWDEYVEGYVDVIKVCYELGITQEDLQIAFGLRFNGVNNGVLVQALHNPPISIRRDQWEESFQEAALLALVKNQLVPAKQNVPSQGGHK